MTLRRIDAAIGALAAIYIVTAVVLAALGIAEPWSAVRAVLGIIAVLLIGRSTG